METKTIIGCCKVYHVYGENGHRQRESFSESYELVQPKEGTLIEVHNSDITGTNDYSEIEITAKNERECDEILNAQLSDGIFENCRTGKILTNYTGNVLIEKIGNVALRVRALVNNERW